ncbi:MAG TPA: BREX-1 system phosphatase PglZ type A, partial [Blastocatellia bacterium]|nr:BREX-1 system phosphatase PglZ type A [Blastocatellia bacterium]
PLADRWSDQVRQLATWEGPGLVTQRRFFAHYVQPFQLKKQKVFVIISDALRYEAAVEFAQRLQTNNRWTAEVEAMFGALPTYTQLGMAALLPGRQLAVDAATAQVTVDGRSATGTANRAEILRVLSGVAATAIQAKDFLELNSKTDGRALMREHEIIYIFHDHIDDVGDKLKTEVKALAAVEQAFDELEQIIKKVAAINGSNMLLTADHGFLFQQTEVADDDMTPLPTEMKWTCRNRRFALGKGRTSDAQVKTFDAAELGLTGEWTAAFPLGLGRFPLQGSGKRFVHGGFSLQEVVVPVVRIHKKRVDDIEQVEVEFTHVPQKITTGQVAITLYQDQPVVDKVLPRTLRVGLFAKDNTELSEIKTVTFDSSDAEARNRETRLLLTLAGTADAYNNREVELRLLETKPGTNQTVVYKAYGLKLQKPFASDFDEF